MEFFEIFGMFFLGLFILYFIWKGFRFQEAMTDNTDTTSDDKNKNKKTTTSTDVGMAGKATDYTLKIKDATTKIMDAVLISKYRTDYENILIQMDDYCNALALQTLLTTPLNDVQKALEKIHILRQGRTDLNEIMKFIDKN
jgi:hypothetical protein